MDTFETLKKLKVVNEAAMQEIERIEEKERKKKKKKGEEDFDSEFWYDSDIADNKEEIHHERDEIEEQAMKKL